MGKLNIGFCLIFCFVILLGLISCVSCIVAEFKKPKWKDIKLDDKLCYLPTSHSLNFGIAALISLITGQIIGNLVLCFNCCSTFRSKKHTRITSAIVAFSWSSFVVAVILLSTATSMSKRQSYGKGWSNHECYLVKDGVYSGSAGLAFISIATTICAAFLFTTSSNQTEQQEPQSQLE